LQRHTERLFGRDYTLLEYWEVGLRDLRAADYLGAAQPLGAALAALMMPGEEGREGLKEAALRQIDQAGLDPARVFLLVNVVESFLPLSAEEEAALWARLRAEGVLQMVTTDLPWGELTWADRLELRGERKLLLRLIRAHFGALPAALEERIEQADSE